MTLKTKNSPLVILSLDAGDPDFIERWAKEGYLPAIASIMERGCWGKTGGAEAICEHGVWAILFSGISRRQHGYHYFRQLKQGTYDLETVTAAGLGVLPFWSYLQGKDKKVAILDAPDIHPVPGLKGIQLCDWAVHNPLFPPTAEPSELLQDVRQVFGPQIKIDEKLESRLAEDRELYRQLLDRVEKKGKLCRHLLAKDRFDLTVAVFAESHTGAHQFWKYRPDARGSEKVTDPTNELTNGIRDIYQAIDREIGLLLEQLPGDANVFIISSVGLHDQYPYRGLIEDFCRKLGYQVSPEPSGKQSFSLMDLARKVLPEPFRVALSQRLLSREQREGLLAEQFRNSTNWKKTTAFATPSAYTSFLRVNLCGREPEGIVEPGAEFENILQRLEADLMQLTDPKTGKPAVKQVVRSYKLFGCDPVRSPLPDLFVEWQPVPYFVEFLAHPKAELVQKKPDFFRGSDHRQNGFIAAAGPSIQGRGAIADISLLDLAPTFLSLMGEPIPEGMTGKPVEALAPENA